MDPEIFGGCGHANTANDKPRRAIQQYAIILLTREHLGGGGTISVMTCHGLLTKRPSPVET